jgi:hypothetical protein
MASLRSLEPEDPLPPKILGIELKFLCLHCETKLMVDYRWQGRTLDCPKCHRMTQVPRFGTAAPLSDAAAASSTSSDLRLSPSELDFLSKSPAAS